MNWSRTKAFLRRVVGKKTPNGLRVNAKGLTPNGTRVTGIRNGKPVTTTLTKYNQNRNMGRPSRNRGPLAGGAYEMV